MVGFGSTGWSMAAATVPPRSPDGSEFGVNMPRGATRNAGDLVIEDLQQLQPFLLAELSDSLRVVLDSVSNDGALRPILPRSRLPELGHGCVVQCKCYFYHTDTILPYHDFGQVPSAAKSRQSIRVE